MVRIVQVAGALMLGSAATPTKLTLYDPSARALPSGFPGNGTTGAHAKAY